MATKTELKQKWVTGYVPVQTDYSEMFDTLDQLPEETQSFITGAKDNFKYINLFNKATTIENETLNTNGLVAASTRPRTALMEVEENATYNNIGMWYGIVFNENKEPIRRFDGGDTTIVGDKYVSMNFLADKREIAMFVKGDLPVNYAPYQLYLDPTKIQGLHYTAPEKVVILGDSITIGQYTSGVSYFHKLRDESRIASDSVLIAKGGRRIRRMSDTLDTADMLNTKKVIIKGGTNSPINLVLGDYSDEATPDVRISSGAYAVGDKMEAGNRVVDGCYDFIFECTTAGTSAAGGVTSITWDTTIGNQTTDGTVVWEMKKIATHYGDLRRNIEKIYDLSVDLEILFIIPIPEGFDIQTDKYDANLTRPEHEATIAFCKANKHRFLDLSKEFPVNFYTYSNLMVDQLHPNDKGQQVITDLVKKEFF